MCVYVHDGKYKRTEPNAVDSEDQCISADKQRCAICDHQVQVCRPATGGGGSTSSSDSSETKTQSLSGSNSLLAGGIIVGALLAAALAYFVYRRYSLAADEKDGFEQSTHLHDIYSAKKSSIIMNPVSWALRGNKASRSQMLDELVGSVIGGDGDDAASGYTSDPASPTSLPIPGDRDNFDVIVQDNSLTARDDE